MAAALKRRTVGVLELLANGPSDHFVQKAAVWPNFAGVMPQAVAVWAEECGAFVHYDIYTGRENPFELLGRGLDVLFISAFTRAAFLAYAIAERARAAGITVVLGGPHARSFPAHASRYFDWVCQLTDRELIKELVRHAIPRRPGEVVGVSRQPSTLPSLRARHRFADLAIGKALPPFRGLPMIGSLGCPYTCSFCIDATVPYQPLPFDELREDLVFIQRRYGEGAFALWHDPNFGVRFAEYMELIEASGTRLFHVAETSLSLLREPNLAAMQRNGFVQVLPGVESWTDFNEKSAARGRSAADKVEQLAHHFALIERYIPGVQANFILGLDDARGDEPWELTKRFVDTTSQAIFPGYFLMTDFRNSPAGARLRAEGRVVPTPFPLLDNLSATNVRPAHYDAVEFFERVVDLLEHTFNRERMVKRFAANRPLALKLVNAARGYTEGTRLIRRRRAFVERLRGDADLRAFMNAESTTPPRLLFDEVRQGLGALGDAVPQELWNSSARYE